MNDGTRSRASGEGSPAVDNSAGNLREAGEGDAASNVANARDQFESSGPLPGGGHWNATQDRESAATSKNDDGQNYQYTFAPDAKADAITGSRNGSHAARGGHKDAEQVNRRGAKPGADNSASKVAAGPKAGENPDNGRSSGAPGKPFNSSGLNTVEQALDGIVNPNAAEHPILAGVMNNLACRGEGIAKGIEQKFIDRVQIFRAVAEGRMGDAFVMGAKQFGGEVAGVATGFGHSVKTAGEAIGDVAYYGTHSREPGASQKIGSALVDGTLEVANIIAAVDGAASIAKGRASGLRGRSTADGVEGAVAQGARRVEHGAARRAENVGIGARNHLPEAGSGRHGPKPSNDVGDVAAFEARQAAFEAGKNLERGYKLPEGNKPREPVNARQHDADLPPPRGAQLDKIAANTAEGKALRQAYGSKQGMEAGKALQENIATRSEAAANRSGAPSFDTATGQAVSQPQDTVTPHFGDASGRLVPEMGFKDGAISHVNQYPGGSPVGSRTLDLGVTENPIAPSEWQNLVGQKGGDVLSGGYDLKVGGGYVKDKAGFRTQSGGVDPKEIRPYTPRLKR